MDPIPVHSRPASSVRATHTAMHLLAGAAIVLLTVGLAAGVACTSAQKQARAPLFPHLIPGPSGQWVRGDCTPPPHTRRVRLTATVKSARAVTGPLRLLAYAGRSPHSLCLDDAFRASRPGRLEPDVAGNLLASFELGAVSPYQSSQLMMTFRVASPGPDEGPKPAAFLRADALSPAHHPAVQMELLKQQGARTRRPPAALSTWFPLQFQARGYARRDRSALVALQQRGGDCTDLSALAVAFYRALETPARIVGGFVCDGPCREPRPHAWVEHLDQGRWQAEDFTRRPVGLDAGRPIGLATFAPSLDARLESTSLVRIDPPTPGVTLETRVDVLD